MPKLRFHLLGLANTETRIENSACPFVQKAVKLSEILKNIGHTVFFYGVEGSEVKCDHFFQVSSRDVLERSYGNYDAARDFLSYDQNDYAHRVFNSNAIEALNGAGTSIMDDSLAE